MIEKEILYLPSAPFVYVDDYTTDGEKLMPGYRYGQPGKNAVIRVLRAEKMENWQGIMDEFGAALQFRAGFQYVGQNTHALEDCLTLLNDWLPGDAYILEILSGHMLLAQEENSDLAVLLRLLNSVGQQWATPIVDNPPNDRPAVPFHVVIKVPPNEMAGFLSRVTECGEQDLVATTLQ